MLTRRKAFTLIELLLVIGVLVILIGLVVWGLKGASDSATGNSTRTTLANLTNMLEELNRKNKLAGFEGDASTGFFIYPIPAPGLPKGGELAPAMVLPDQADRFGLAVQHTAEVMRRLNSIPDNKTVFAKFPSDQLLAVPPAGTFIGGTVVLDGWRNPILFVPSAGLVKVQSKLKDTYSGGSYSRGARVIQSGEIWTATDSTNASPPAAPWFEGIRSPDGRPFWASAGPDGSFSDGDDNIYSFEH